MTDTERIAQLEEERKQWRDPDNFVDILLKDMDGESLLDFGGVEHEKAEGMEHTLMFVRSGIKKTFASAYEPKVMTHTQRQGAEGDNHG